MTTGGRGRGRGGEYRTCGVRNKSITIFYWTKKKRRNFSGPFSVTRTMIPWQRGAYILFIVTLGIWRTRKIHYCPWIALVGGRYIIINRTGPLLWQEEQQLRSWGSPTAHSNSKGAGEVVKEEEQQFTLCNLFNFYYHKRVFNLQSPGPFFSSTGHATEQRLSSDHKEWTWTHTTRG